MTLNRAIDLIRLNIADPSSVPIKLLNIAQELSIRAMERLQSYRHLHVSTEYMLLKGETL